MKHLKTLGLAAVAAAALMALVGASSASATVLCSSNLDTQMCPEASIWPSGTAVTASLKAGTKAKLETEFLTIECSKSAVGGKITNAGSTVATVEIEVTTLTFEECNCPVTVIKKGTLTIHAKPEGTKDTDNGTLTGNGQEVTVNCSTIFGTVHCIYLTANTDLGTVTGGNPAIIDASANIPRLTTNALCANLATWKAEYEVTAPKPAYVITG